MELKVPRLKKVKNLDRLSYRDHIDPDYEYCSYRTFKCSSTNSLAIAVMLRFFENLLVESSPRAQYVKNFKYAY